MSVANAKAKLKIAISALESAEKELDALARADADEVASKKSGIRKKIDGATPYLRQASSLVHSLR